MSVTGLEARVAAAVNRLSRELRETFVDRLESLVVYGAHALPGPPTGDLAIVTDVHTLALVSAVRFGDLSACAARADGWSRQGLAVPLILTRAEFVRSLDAFPLEYGDIIDRHLVIAGDRPFEGLSVAAPDKRRACEVETKSHLIHLREGYMETAERADAIARLIAASAEPFARLLRHVASLEGPAPADRGELSRLVEARVGLPADIVYQILRIRRLEDIQASDAIVLFPAYLDAVERLWQFVDTWKA